ncbi:MAG: flagellar biosynthesis protein FlhB [Nitrospinaceae bacterium]|jgi:flagellar biosynthesis protein FlhB|nr:flagellar biosynthesis protein FlhB [Nitrospina sp.]MBT5867879.1 flagellar biosynthesis protein FlhB [Nitrospinaceae bacterium]MBT6346557.1 flagellar biosynthesis protein FlhB [Nitrospina sp.]
MAEDNKDQKTEDPSSKRISDSQEKGNFAHSREINSSFILLAALTGFMSLGEQSARDVMSAWTTSIVEAGTLQLTSEELFKVIVTSMKDFLKIIGPFLFLIMLGGIGSNIVQIGGLRFSTHPLIPKFNKLNPLTGFGRIFSKNTLMELFKSLFKVGIISVVSYYTIKSHWTEIPGLMGFGVGQSLSFMGQVALEIIFYVLLIMIFLSLIDFAFQRFTYHENLRMTKQEVKEERKETDGNPQIKQRIRTVQMEMARKRMMSAVPDADVIVTNPTHISIAIKYDPNNSSAPLVVAKGVGPIAMRIREIAKENGVPLVEDKPLARALNKTVEVGQLIPSSLYKAVAEILAYVYKLKHHS